MKRTLALFACLQLAAHVLAAEAYPGWKHTGALTILTTPDGANLPASASVEQFPLLVRLNKDWFDFSQAKAGGDDVRFTSSTGSALPFQIEEWDAANGTASVWVRIPRIEGNARQTIHLHWGKADAASESNAKAVFNDSNGYLSVWHMGDVVKDDAGTLESKDVDTTAAAGIVGKARHFAGKQGIFCGDKIEGYPTGSSPHTSEAWFRPEKSNGNVLGWGNEQGQGKVVMQFTSPPHVRMDCYFSESTIASEGTMLMNEWAHVVHTYEQGHAKLYVNGVLAGESLPKGTPLNIRTPARLWIGGWYNNYNYMGDIDEVRISKVTRSADWVRLEYENQKPLQTLVGPIVQPAASLAVSPAQVTVLEGKSTTITALAGAAQKLMWSLIRDGKETVVAVDRFSYSFDAGRVTGDTSVSLRLKAIYADKVETKDVPITIKESIPDPVFTLTAPSAWDGRSTIEVVPHVTNLRAMQSSGAGEIKTEWNAGPFAVIKEIQPRKLILKRAQNSGKLIVSASMSNGGKAITQSATIDVTEPKKDPWVARIPAKDEKPDDGQFYARDDSGHGTLFYNGTLTEAGDEVFLKVMVADPITTGESLYKNESQKLDADKAYAFAVKLKPGLIKYRVEFGTRAGGKDTLLHKAENLVCGDAYIIEGQSNGLTTDTREQSPPDTNEWIRSYGRPSQNPKDNQGNLWCLPVWKAQKGEKAELGWWGMELAKRLLESQKMPVFIINAAVGGTRIDQHQRSASDPTDLSTIYGRMLWRVQQAKLTHGIRGILWHQGESDQGSDGPTGGYGWQSYHQLFVDMAAGWKQDFPNVQHYYTFQIWPNSCAMGGKLGSGDRLREKQRTLPQLFSNMSIMSTLGVRPPGGCHFPLVGWSEFARLIQPLMERDNYGKLPTESITPPNLRSVSFANSAKDTIALEFDQPVLWGDALADQFYLDGEKGRVNSGTVSGNVLTLKLKEPSAAQTITYLKEVSWNQDQLLTGANGIAALTFCEVPIQPAKR